MSGDLKVYVLMRCSKKTGYVDTTMTGMGSALLRMWALNNTTSSKITFIFDRESGKIVYAVQGRKDGFPKVKDAKKDGYLGYCEEIGISLEDLHSIKDERFDEEEE